MQIQLTINQDDINKLSKTASRILDAATKDPALIQVLYRMATANNPPTKTKSKKPKAKRAKP
jgi:hypothetical protein